MDIKTKFSAVILTAIATSISFAAGVGELVQGWGETATALQVLLVIGASLVGLGMMAAGGMQLKKHGENPQQVPLNKGLIFLASGALLFGLSATSTTMLDTIFGTGAAEGSTEVSSEF
ncbi:hypothetical protein [Vibrio sp. EA2]|uniref:hypothetical protein n=1 Tax=Vibrio sp. EA2 TaxID=3079860 RepID=UPI00294A979E|nr:hypothetical protein [Vibrio sp. EA2]MDV6250230.1 hypothetical protein [Vibrio sp. EA2]